MLFWLLSALYSSTNAINIFPTLVSKSLLKILNDTEARMDPWETQLNICQADVESLIAEWKNNSFWVIYWMSLIFLMFFSLGESKHSFKWKVKFSLETYCGNLYLPLFSWNTRNCTAMCALNCVQWYHYLGSLYTEVSQMKNQAWR